LLSVAAAVVVVLVVVVVVVVVVISTVPDFPPFVTMYITLANERNAAVSYKKKK